MSGSTRFLFLFSPPPPLLFRRRFSSGLTNLRCLSRCVASYSSSISFFGCRDQCLHSVSVSSPPVIPLLLPLSRFHCHRARFSAAASAPYPHSPWLEWSELLRALSDTGYYSDSRSFSGDGNEFAPSFPDELLSPAHACLALARDRPNLLTMVSRRDVEIVVKNVTPFLLKNGEDSVKRMRQYLSSDAHGTGNMQDMDKATMVDLMKYLLSYIGDFVSSDKNNLRYQEATESSVRSLLNEIAKLSSISHESNVQNQSQEPRSIHQNINMKRGDWICPRCNGLNFARNIKCFGCEESRPKRQLTGGEWECPQCDFYNYGRNIVCLRCDCKRPGSILLNDSTENEENFPEIMPLRKGVNRFVVSSKKTPLERNRMDTAQRTETSRSLDEILGSSSSSSFKSDEKKGSSREFESSRASDSDFVPFVPLPSDMFAKKPEKVENSADNSSKKARVEKEEEKSARWFKRVTELHGVSDLDQISDEDFPDIMPMRKGENRFVISKKKDRSLTSSSSTPVLKRKMAMEQAEESNFVPFVPFPPGYFAKTKQSERMTPVLEASGGNSVTKIDKSHEVSESSCKGDGESLEGSLVKESDPLDMSEEAKAERWFRRAAQIKNISELSDIPDEDFPSIMPMRKGVNRFVVSKRKSPYQRRLESQQNRRNPPISDSSSPVTGDT